MTYFNDMWQLAIEGQKQGIWFWAALYTFIVCSYSLMFQLRTRYWPCTQGQLAGLGIEKFGATDWVTSNQDYVSKALYTYEVSGVNYEGSRISPWVFIASHNAKCVLEKQMSSIQHSPDGRLKVFYNPANPQKSYLIIAGKTGICITAVVCVFPLFTYFINYPL